MTGESRLFLLRIPTTHLGMRPLCRRSLSLKAQWIEQAQSMPRTGGACLRRRAARRHQDGRTRSDRCRTSLSGLSPSTSGTRLIAAALQAAVQRGAAELSNRALERIQAVIQREQRVPAATMTACCLSKRTVERGSFGLVLSRTCSRRFHLATVFGSRRTAAPTL